MDSITYIIQIIIFAIASFLHGITGMAFPMIGTTSLSLAFSLPAAIAMIAVPSMIMNLIVLFSNNKNGFINEFIYYFTKYKTLILSSLIGSIVGIKLLLIVPVGIMYILMASVTLLYVLSEYLSDKGIIRTVKVSTGFGNTLFFGFLAGIVGGATNAMSPILMMYLFSKTDDKQEIVKSSNICYLFGKVVQIALLGGTISELESNEVMLMVFITFVSIFFLFLGIRFRGSVSDRVFKNSIYIILLVLSIKVGMSGINLLLSG